VVYELSELQLPTLSRGTTVAVYTNVTSDHLDRHGTLEAYRAVKRRLAELVDPRGSLVLNAEDPVVASYSGLGTAPAVLYRRDRPLAGGLGVVDGWIAADDVRRLDLAGGGTASVGSGGRIMPVDELGIPGQHNISNALAAIAVALLFGVDVATIRAAAAAFTGVEHRLEPVALVEGVRFVNDSQGTQPDAVIAALRAFESPVVLIAGGRDKGVDLRELVRVAATRTVATIVIGESGPDLGRRLVDAGVPIVQPAASMTEAVERADALARAARATADPGTVATVLLSPAAASFDMFTDYAARGQAFKDAVAALIRRRAESGR
jgi:UDP-N-acetylmuramoylalanine--D-glutamate ligase